MEPLPGKSHKNGAKSPGPEVERAKTAFDRLPKLVRFLLVHCGIGLAVGVIFTSLVIQLNTAGIKDMLAASSEPYIPMFLLYASTALSFASLNMGVAVMTLPTDKRDWERQNLDDDT